MSNSEIIEWLKKKAETVPMPGARKMYQAAAKALEEQKYMISRQAVMDALNNIEIPRNASWYQYYQQALTAVDKLPPAPTTEVATDINVATKDGTNLAEVGTDLISRDAVKELLNNNGLPYHINPVLWKELNDLPSAQPEIIRCAECKWFQCNMRQDGYLPKGVDEFECRHWCGYCDPTDFCSYAERR